MTQSDDECPDRAAEWRPPPADECEQYSYAAPVGDQGDQLQFRQRWDVNGRLADFAIVLMSPLEGELRCVAECDIRHGDLHVHLLNQRGIRTVRESIQSVVTQQDVEKAYDAALDVFTEKWEDYKRRWRNG